MRTLRYSFLTKCKKEEYLKGIQKERKEKEEEGKIKIVRYQENRAESLDKIKKLVFREYEKAQTIPAYKAFLEAKFYNFLL